MALEISFSGSINPSLQVGDNAYVSDITSSIVVGTPEHIGVITNIGPGGITVDSSWTWDSSKKWFFSFSKPIEINESSIKGYYADVTFENESKKYAELFAISSEIALSSK